jgi:hypothetical protein
MRVPTHQDGGIEARAALEGELWNRAAQTKCSGGDDSRGGFTISAMLEAAGRSTLLQQNQDAWSSLLQMRSLKRRHSRAKALVWPEGFFGQISIEFA